MKNLKRGVKQFDLLLFDNKHTIFFYRLRTRKERFTKRFNFNKFFQICKRKRATFQLRPFKMRIRQVGVCFNKKNK